MKTVKQRLLLAGSREVDHLMSGTDALESYLFKDDFLDIWLGMWRVRRIKTDPCVALFGLADSLRRLAELAAMHGADLATSRLTADELRDVVSFRLAGDNE